MTKCAKLMEHVEAQWWNLWYNQVWSSLFPWSKWSTPQYNLRVGNVSLKGSAPNLGKWRYIIYKVVTVYPNQAERE